MYNGREFPHGLIHWEKKDMPQMRDFNQDNHTLDTEAMWKSDYDPRGFERDVYGEIYAEAPGSTALQRTVDAPNVPALSQITGVPFYVRSATDGQAGTVTLAIRGKDGADLGAYPLAFPAPTGTGQIETAPAGWVRAGGVYTLVLGTAGTLTVLNPQVQAATTTAPGVVQLNDTLADTSTAQALTAAQGKALEDKKVDKTQILQAGGSSTTSIMSQNAVTKALDSKANTTDVLTKTNTTSYIPSASYHPATKAYVDGKVPTSVSYATSAGTANSAGTATVAAKLGSGGNTATAMTFNRWWTPGQPDYLWGTNNADLSTMHLYGRSTLAVDNAARLNSVDGSNYARTDVPTTFASSVSFPLNTNIMFGPYNSVMGHSAANGQQLNLRTDYRVCVVGQTNGGAWMPLQALRVTESSSERFKSALREEDDTVVDRLAKLRPKSFRYKSEQANAPAHHGLVAEEVYEIFPEVVDLDDEGRPEGVHYSGLIGPIIKAFQAQQKAIADIQQQLASLTENKKST
ncbi:MAG: hypothetical protein GXY32_08795 [Ruminococcaceae bacterium]|nr:hypothetical protein [Oscillospiraceae bacterium]